MTPTTTYPTLSSSEAITWKEDWCWKSFAHFSLFVSKKINKKKAIGTGKWLSDFISRGRLLSPQKSTREISALQACRREKWRRHGQGGSSASLKVFAGRAGCLLRHNYTRAWQAVRAIASATNILHEDHSPRYPLLPYTVRTRPQIMPPIDLSFEDARLQSWFASRHESLPSRRTIPV